MKNRSCYTCIHDNTRVLITKKNTNSVWFKDGRLIPRMNGKALTLTVSPTVVEHYFMYPSLELRNNGGEWVLPGGKSANHETYLDASIREWNEETGCCIKMATSEGGEEKEVEAANIRLLSIASCGADRVYPESYHMYSHPFGTFHALKIKVSPAQLDDILLKVNSVLECPERVRFREKIRMFLQHKIDSEAFSIDDFVLQCDELSHAAIVNLNEVGSFFSCQDTQGWFLDIVNSIDHSKLLTDDTGDAQISGIADSLMSTKLQEKDGDISKQPPDNSRRVCRYWSKNNTCQFGTRCRFLHEA